MFGKRKQDPREDLKGQLFTADNPGPGHFYLRGQQISYRFNVALRLLFIDAQEAQKTNSETGFP